MEENVQAKEANLEFNNPVDKKEEEKRKKEQEKRLKLLEKIGKDKDFKKFTNSLEDLCLTNHKTSVESCAKNGQLFSYDGKLVLENLDNIDQDTVLDRSITIKDKKLDYIKLYQLMKSGKLVFVGNDKLPKAYTYNRKTGKFELYEINKKKESANMADREPLKWYKIGIALIYAVFALFKAIINKFRIPRLMKEYKENIDKCGQEYVCANMMKRQEEVNLVGKEKNIVNDQDKSLHNELFSEEEKNADLKNLINNEEKENNLGNLITNEIPNNELVKDSNDTLINAINELDQVELFKDEAENDIKNDIKNDNVDNENNIDNGNNNLYRENTLKDDLNKTQDNLNNINNNTLNDNIIDLTKKNDANNNIINENNVNEKDAIQDLANNNISNNDIKNENNITDDNIINENTDNIIKNEENIINTNNTINNLSFSEEMNISDNKLNNSLIDMFKNDANANELLTFNSLDELPDNYFAGIDGGLFEFDDLDLFKEDNKIVKNNNI